MRIPESRSAGAIRIEALEPRRLLSVVAPATISASIRYREAPDGATDRARITWTDNNGSETAYRVEWSPDGVTNWSTLGGADLPPNTTLATQVLDAGQKYFYRVRAIENGLVSAPSTAVTPTTPLDRVVQVSATANGSSVILSWPFDSEAVSYDVYRKKRGETNWTLLTLRSLMARSTGYTDLVTTGTAYEYQVQRVTKNFFGTVDGVAYGYVYAGSHLPMVESRGCALLVVDQTLAAPLSNDLLAYRRDLIADGWSVVQINAPRDNGDARLAATVKTMIRQAATRPGGIQTIVLIGHVAVPYSGTTEWDGHTEHAGAWPADAYYGESVGLPQQGTWTDTATFINTTYPDNDNRPGDGKFDQNTLPARVTVPVGRIDFANLPGMRWSFTPSVPVDQVEPLLLKRYFQKDHLWRSGQIDVPLAALVDDQLGSGEAENGWRNFAPLVGAANTRAADWRTMLQGQSYLFSSGAGPGNFTYATNVVGITDLQPASAKLNCVFNMMFGSYFGDWNKASNLLREIQATTGTSLVAMMAGAPNWFIHALGLGETFGQVAMDSQNNNFNGPYQPSSIGMFSPQDALLGDPTLTMSVVKPVKQLSADLSLGGATVRWIAPSDLEIIGYHVYRALSPDEPFTRLTIAPIPAAGTNMTYADPGPLNPLGRYTYMVRAIKLQESASGSHYQLSQGMTADTMLQRPGGSTKSTTPSPGAPFSQTRLIDVVDPPEELEAMSLSR